MGKELYLECPQCRARGMYGRNAKGEMVFFYVTYGKKIVPTKNADGPVDFEGVDLMDIRCVSCSWSGTVNKLKKVTEQ
jgi:hypothetical protein